MPMAISGAMKIEVTQQPGSGTAGDLRQDADG